MSLSVCNGGASYKTPQRSPFSCKSVRAVPNSSGSCSSDTGSNSAFSFNQHHPQPSSTSPYQNGHSINSNNNVARTGSVASSSLTSLQSRSPSPQSEPVVMFRSSHQQPASDDSGISMGFSPRPQPLASSNLPPRPHGSN